MKLMTRCTGCSVTEGVHVTHLFASPLFLFGGILKDSTLFELRKDRYAVAGAWRISPNELTEEKKQTITTAKYIPQKVKFLFHCFRVPVCQGATHAAGE